MTATEPARDGDDECTCEGEPRLANAALTYPYALFSAGSISGGLKPNSCARREPANRSRAGRLNPANRIVRQDTVHLDPFCSNRMYSLSGREINDEAKRGKFEE